MQLHYALLLFIIYASYISHLGMKPFQLENQHILVFGLLGPDSFRDFSRLFLGSNFGPIPNGKRACIFPKSR